MNFFLKAKYNQIHQDTNNFEYIIYLPEYLAAFSLLDLVAGSSGWISKRISYSR